MGKKCDLKDSERGKVFSARMTGQNISETADLQGFFFNTAVSRNKSKYVLLMPQVGVEWLDCFNLIGRPYNNSTNHWLQPRFAEEHL